MSPAERKEYLQLVAIGKTDEEIAIIMDLDTRRQARRRVESLMNFYKASTRTYMIVKAIAAEHIDPKELARMTGIVLLVSATLFAPPRIAPKSAPKRHTTELVARRSVNQYETYMSRVA